MACRGYESFDVSKFDFCVWLVVGMRVLMFLNLISVGSCRGYESFDVFKFDYFGRFISCMRVLMFLNLISVCGLSWVSEF